MTSQIEISLSQIANEAADTQAPALAPGQEPQLVIVEECGDNLYIVDGFHRVAGYVAWAIENGINLDECKINVVRCDDADLIAAAAEPGPDQAAALEAIYSSL